MLRSVLVDAFVFNCVAAFVKYTAGEASRALAFDRGGAAPTPRY
jgi:hypothetical protein